MGRALCQVLLGPSLPTSAERFEPFKRRPDRSPVRQTQRRNVTEPDFEVEAPLASSKEFVWIMPERVIRLGERVSALLIDGPDGAARAICDTTEGCIDLAGEAGIFCQRDGFFSLRS